MTEDSKVEKSARKMPPNAGKGRAKGVPNKTTALLKDAILKAAEAAHDDGMIGYLTKQATDNPTAFMGLLGKVLPMQITGDPDAPIVTRIELVAPGHDNS